MQEEKDGSFYFDADQNLCCGYVKILDLVSDFCSNNNQDQEVIRLEQGTNKLIANQSKLCTPLFIYSQKKLISNFLNYQNALKETFNDKIEAIISYSIKANFNRYILDLFHKQGSWCSLVSKNELKLALSIGFPGTNLIFNGNGKTLHEITLAINEDCFLNVDSLFNLEHTIKVCKQMSKHLLPAKILVRVNLSISADVHEYLSTSNKSCKFGVDEKQTESIIELAKSNPDLVKLCGFHIHLGSTIKKLDIFEHSIEMLMRLINKLDEKFDLQSVDTINFGGGLGIDYEDKYKSETKASSSLPKAKDLVSAINSGLKFLKRESLIKRIIIEPGRSLVGDAAILLCKLIGVKRNDDSKTFLVIDGSMCEVIRPCLYSAYHHIEFISKLRNSEACLVDVVGPVCESGDFLGKDRILSISTSCSEDQESEAYLAIMDAGAYCASMASNYNLHQRPAELVIDNDRILLARRQDTFESLLQHYI